MYTVTLQQKQHPTYILSDREGRSSLEVVPERGGLITRWRLQERDILYLDEERFANPQLSVRGGIPILFPICGNLPDNIYTHNNRQYSLKQHGFARDLPWEVAAQITDRQAGIELVLKSNEKTRASYPFDFELAFTYELRGNNLKIRQKITNHSTETMPFSVGFHPYFGVRDKQQLDLDIPASEYLDQIGKGTHSFNGKFDFNKEEIDVAFTSIDRNFASFQDNQSRLKLELAYSDIYTTVVFWAVKGKDYICLEPWSAPRNALNTGERLTRLQPNASLDATIDIEANFF